MSLFVIMKDIVVFTHEDTVYRVQKSDPSFKTVKAALQKQDVSGAAQAYKKRYGGETPNLKVVAGKIILKNDKITLGSEFAEAFAYAQNYGEADEKTLDLFFTNVAKNPDERSRQGLAKFIAVNRLPITDRGTLLAYRYVNGNFYDCYTGRMDNMIGNEVRMRREDCDHNPNQTCSAGLHVCHHEYMGGQGYNRVHLVVEVRPQDVVAVPSDYNNMKMRTCEFRVLCTLDYFKSRLLLCPQAALGKVPVFLTAQMADWNPLDDIPAEFHHRYKPTDGAAWAAA